MRLGWAALALPVLKSTSLAVSESRKAIQFQSDHADGDANAASLSARIAMWLCPRRRFPGSVL